MPITRENIPYIGLHSIIVNGVLSLNREVHKAVSTVKSENCTQNIRKTPQVKIFELRNDNRKIRNIRNKN